MEFVELIVAIHDHLDRAGISHAFGGALALGYIANPRGTVDIDVNAFLEPSAIHAVDAALSPLGFRRTGSADDVPIAGIRYEQPSDPFPVDVFPSLDGRYADIERRRVHHRFGRGNDVLPFLCAEDLSIFKLSYGRPQDWVDLRAIAAARPDIDVEAIEELLVALRGPTMYPRIVRFRSFVAASQPEP